MRKTARWLVVCNITIAATLVINSWESLRNSRDADEAAARQTAVNLAHALSIEVAAELRLIDNALSTVDLSIGRATSDDERLETIHRMAAEQRNLLPYVSALRFADTHGQVLAGLGIGELPTNVRTRPYFVKAKVTAAMVVSEPLRSIVTNEWCIILARRLMTQEGAFYGVVYAVITAKHFAERFAKLDMGDSGAIALRSESLMLIARYANSEPGSIKGIGGAVVSQEMIRALSESRDQGWYLTPTALDNVERVTAYRRVPGYPLLVFTGLATQEFLATWRSEVIQHLGLVVFILLISTSFSAYMYRRQKHEREARSTAVRVAREQSLMLENDLVGMIRIRGRVTLWVNKAAHRIFGYEVGELLSQSTRILYLDDESYARVGEQYPTLVAKGHFSSQLQMRRRDGDPIWIDLRGALVSEEESLWMLIDIDALKRSESRARELALHDPLTGLANRRLLDAHLENALANAKRNRAQLAVCYVDLDGFKQINDVHGHEAGDEVLKAAAQRLMGTVRSNDIVARLGGDEFALVLCSVGGASEAVSVMQRCLDRVGDPIRLQTNVVVRVNASAGIALGDGDSLPADLLRSADVYMYEAKRSGKGCIKLGEKS